MNESDNSINVKIMDMLTWCTSETIIMNWESLGKWRGECIDIVDDELLLE
jgi:hypothetical protein